MSLVAVNRNVISRSQWTPLRLTSNITRHVIKGSEDVARPLYRSYSKPSLYALHHRTRQTSKPRFQELRNRIHRNPEHRKRNSNSNNREHLCLRCSVLLIPPRPYRFLYWAPSPPRPRPPPPPPPPLTLCPHGSYRISSNVVSRKAVRRRTTNRAQSITTLYCLTGTRNCSKTLRSSGPCT